MMPLHRGLDDLRSLRTEIDEKASKLFKAREGIPSFSVTRIVRNGDRSGETKELDDAVLVKDEHVYNLSQARVLSDTLDKATQIFTVSQTNSWTTLNISLDVFEGFLNIYKISPSFWRYIFAFGFKSEGNGFVFPTFNRRKTASRNFPASVKYEFSYMLRRVELNGRNDEDEDCPWSIRQTAVYHQLICQQGNEIYDQKEDLKDLNKTQSTFVLIAPSSNAQVRLLDCLEQEVWDKTRRAPGWDIHRALIADSLRGWSHYMEFLQRRLNDQSNIATVGNITTIVKDGSSSSPLPNFDIHVLHRQELKVIEDQVLEAQLILPSMIDSIRGVKEACVLWSTKHVNDSVQNIELEAIIDELEDYEKQAIMLVELARILKSSAKSTAKLLSDLLSHEEAVASHEEAVALKELAAETKQESRLMCQMAEKGTKDAAAVKILTIIFLLYLPTTIVANFFSTEFVKMGENNQIQVSRHVWLLAVISIPFTFLTFIFWWVWVQFTKVAAATTPEQPEVPSLQRTHSLRPAMSWKKRLPTSDIESRLGIPSPTHTWKSTRTATTVKWG